jgi:hypothetical protein
MSTIKWTPLKTNTPTVTANKVNDAADNEAVINTGHTTEHVMKEASDNFNVI